MSIKDACFVDYINEKLSRYEEGERMEADQLMTLTANKYTSLMIMNQWEAPSPHDATIQARVQSGETTMRAQMCSEAATTKESAQEEGGPKYESTTSQMVEQQRETAKRDNFPISECGMETNGTGVPRKLGENVRDDGSVTLLRVVKRRHSEFSTRNGHERVH